MSDVASHLAFLRDPRLAALATSATPAWLWSTDATRILWANPVGAAIFGAGPPAALAARRFDPKDQAAAQIARLLGTLRLGRGAPPRPPGRAAARRRRRARAPARVGRRIGPGAEVQLLARPPRRSHRRRAGGRDGAGRPGAHPRRAGAPALRGLGPRHRGLHARRPPD